MKLFYELLRVAVGTQICLSRTPSVDEWDKLYRMAQKQSLVGICFMALHRLGADVDDGFVRLGINEIQYLTWLGESASIQQRNELVIDHCAELQRLLSKEGFLSCMLKGQGVALLYNDSLRLLRQSGDIDVWISDRQERVLDFIQKTTPTTRITKLHADLSVFDDTIVEVHFTPSYLRCFWCNRQLQKWFKTFRSFDSFEEVSGFRIPSDDFNLVYLAIHIFRHLLGEGIGLRQLMDYYFALKHVEDNGIRKQAFSVLTTLGLGKFAAALMWISREVFGLTEDKMICEPSEKLGRLILKEIEMAGNFGQYDVRRNHDETSWKRFCRTNSKNLIFLRYFPEEVLCTPIYRIWHKGWQILHGYQG